MVDDDEFLGVEQVMGDDEGADGIVGGDASGVADHVCVAGMQAEAVLEQDAGIHAGEDRDVALGADREIAQVEIARRRLRWPLTVRLLRTSFSAPGSGSKSPLAREEARRMGYPDLVCQRLTSNDQDQQLVYPLQSARELFAMNLLL